MKGSPANRGTIKGTKGHTMAKLIDMGGTSDYVRGSKSYEKRWGEMGDDERSRFTDVKDFEKQGEAWWAKQGKGGTDNIEIEKMARIGDVETDDKPFDGKLKRATEPEKTDDTYKSKKTKKLEGKLTDVKSGSRRERRLEEKLFKSRKKDAMTPEERIAAKQKTREEIGKGLEYFGQSRTFQEGAPSYLDYELRQERVDLANRRADSQELEKSDTYADPYDVTGMTDREIYDKEMESESMSGDDARFEEWKKRREEGKA